ncbi:MAG TPA: post-transcriptional regulator [Pseudogracilibacillus sp.]|nr:post-transcriptional regulator [Pseudogracilibacillus sp.]
MVRLSPNNWKEEVKPFLQSKQKEFEAMGYKEVSTEQIWACLQTLVWREKEPKRIHEVVRDVLKLQHDMYMNYLQLVAIRADETDMMESIQSLMGPQE